MRSNGGFGELVEIIKSQKMLGLAFTEDTNLIHFQKLVSFVKATQRTETINDRNLKSIKRAAKNSKVSDGAVNFKNEKFAS